MMKKNLLRQLWITITTGLFCSFSILYAWNGLTASAGDSLTAVKWNELVDKVSWINTGVTWDRAAIWWPSPHPTDALSVYNNTDSVSAIGLIWQSTTHDLSLVYRIGDTAKAQVRYYPGTDSLNLWTQWDYLTQLVLEKWWNVWIWTNNPEAKLDVNGFVAAKWISINHATDAFINIKQETWGDGYAIGADVDWWDSIVFRPIVNNTMWLPNVIFKTNGNVWIWTTDPKGKLDIKGGNLQVTKWASWDWSTRNAWIIFARTDYPENYLNLISNSHSGTMGNGTMTFELATWASSRASVMVLQNDGHVWIWETNPEAQLEVNGDILFWGPVDSLEWRLSSGAWIFRLQNGPNYNSWQTKLEARSIWWSGWKFQLAIETANSAGYPNYSFIEDSNSWLRNFSGVDDKVAITTGWTDRLVIDSDGDVWIWELNPTAKLHVNWTVKFPALPNCDEWDVVKFSVNWLYCD